MFRTKDLAGTEHQEVMPCTTENVPYDFVHRTHLPVGVPIDDFCQRAVSHVLHKHFPDREGNRRPGGVGSRHDGSSLLLLLPEVWVRNPESASPPAVCHVGPGYGPSANIVVLPDCRT